MRRTKTKHGAHGPAEDAAAAAEVSEAIRFIEAHLFESLCVDTVAERCGISPFHFSRRFSAAVGESLIAYVRGRRLERAAVRLREEPQTSVLQIALDSRFESHATFTRAFTRAFGMSPRLFRCSPEPPLRKRRSTMASAPLLTQSVELIESFQIAGLSAHFEPSRYPEVAELWKAFVPHANFAGRLGDGETCGAFRNRDFMTGSFEHLAGARIEAGRTPVGLTIWTVPAGEYLVFRQNLFEGELHPQVAAAQAEIWGTRVPQSGRKLASTPDFQLYPANFAVEGGSITYCIPLEKLDAPVEIVK